MKKTAVMQPSKMLVLRRRRFTSECWLGGLESLKYFNYYFKAHKKCLESRINFALGFICMSLYLHIDYCILICCSQVKHASKFDLDT
jgi:hypothetical protein